MRNFFFTLLMVALLGAAGYVAYLGGIPPAPSSRRDHQAIETYLERLRPLAAIRKDDLVVPEAAFRPLALPIIPPLPEAAPGRANPFL